MMCMNIFFTNPVMYLHDVTVNSIINDSIMILFNVIAMCMFGMMITYVL